VTQAMERKFVLIRYLPYATLLSNLLKASTVANLLYARAL
jgi:hypothetical protein